MATISKDKRTGKYRVLIRKKGLPPVSQTFSRRKDANQFAQRIEGDREQHLAIGNSVARSMSLSQLIDEYLTQWEGRDSTTLARLEWWRKEYGKRLIGDIDKTVVREGLAKLATIKKRGGRGKCNGAEVSGKRTPATLNRYRSALSGVFTYAVKELDLPENPVQKIRTLKEPRGRIRFLSDAELTALLKACKVSKWDRLHLLVLMAVTTGARRGELLRLKWSDIDLKRRKAFVNETKNGEPRILPLTEALVSELVKRREVGKGDVFPASGGIKGGFAFSKHWDQALQSASIENFRFHDLRHTAASYLAMNGATLHEIAEVLGHKQLEITRRYAHLCADHKAKLIDRVMGDIHE